MEHVYSCNDLTGLDTKGCIRDGVRRTATYSDERSGHHRPSGPVITPKERASTNKLVECGVECGPAQLASATPRVVPVAYPTTEKMFYRLFISFFKCCPNCCVKKVYREYPISNPLPTMFSLFR